MMGIRRGALAPERERCVQLYKDGGCTRTAASLKSANRGSKINAGGCKVRNKEAKTAAKAGEKQKRKRKPGARGGKGGAAGVWPRT
jgi:hypothetical protein